MRDDRQIGRVYWAYWALHVAERHFGQAHQQRAKRQQQAEDNNTASTGSRANVVVTTRNSLVNTPNGGSPAIAATPATSSQPSNGCVVVNPPISAIRWVPFTWATWPTVKKIADLVRLCMVICNSPARLPNGPAIPNANTIIPMCSI